MTEFPGRLLGIDHGTEVIGLATCDRIGLIATPREIIYRTTRQADFEQIEQFVVQEAVVGVVIGMPPRPINPTFDTPQADIVENWGHRLARKLRIPCYFWDEGLSSFDAELLMANAMYDQPDRIDAHAAAVILQSLLDAVREGRPFPAPFWQPKR